MSHNILLTGASGYLGGDLLAALAESKLPPYASLYALVRNPEQAEAVRRYNAKPLIFDAKNEAEVFKNVVDNQITVVYFLIDAMSVVSQTYFIKALQAVNQRTGAIVHFLHTSGAKLFSSHAGAPTDRDFHDDDPSIFDIQKGQVPELAAVQPAIDTNNTIVELAEKSGVRSYIFIPCIVYGKSRGFGNAISIQTTAVVQAIRALGRGFYLMPGRPTWPVCQISDNTNLYIELLRGILSGENVDYGKQGYYLAASGNVIWDDIYAAFAKAMASKGTVQDVHLQTADEEAIEKIGEALACPKEFVPLQISGRCTLTATHGKKLGWDPRYAPAHILEDAPNEVGRILDNSK